MHTHNARPTKKNKPGLSRAGNDCSLAPTPRTFVFISLAFIAMPPGRSASCRLKPGATVEAEIRGGERHRTYPWDLSEGRGSRRHDSHYKHVCIRTLFGALICRFAQCTSVPKPCRHPAVSYWCASSSARAQSEEPDGSTGSRLLPRRLSLFPRIRTIQATSRAKNEGCGGQ